MENQAPGAARSTEARRRGGSHPNHPSPYTDCTITARPPKRKQRNVTCLAARMKALWFQGWAPCLCYGSITNIPSIPWGGVSLRILTLALRSRPYCHSSQSEKQTRGVWCLAKQGPSWLVCGEPKLKPRSLNLSRAFVSSSLDLSFRPFSINPLLPDASARGWIFWEANEESQNTADQH